MLMLNRYYEEWSNEWTKQRWLDYLLNTYGNFKVAAACKLADGTAVWTKHISYADLQQKEDIDWIPEIHCTKKNFIKAINNRTILEPEIVLDFDEPGTMQKTIPLLKKNCVDFELWSTGSRGYHVHIIMPEMFNKKHPLLFKQRLMERFHSDTMKKSTNVMIALENTPHWKTGVERKKVIKI